MQLEDHILVLLVRIEKLEERLKKLEKVEQENKLLRRRLNMDSNNSSKPPSSDSIFKRPARQYPKKQDRKSNRKPGGQPGHKGKKFERADYYEDHYMESCPSCDSSTLEIVDKRTCFVTTQKEQYITD